MKNNNKGLSIVEVIVSIGISSMIALGTTYAVVTSMNGMSHIKNMNLAEDSIQLISGMLTDSNYCSLHFRGLTIPTTMNTVIQSNVVFKDMDTPTSLGTTEIFKEGMKYQNSLELSSVKLYVDSKVGTNRFIGSIRVTYKGTSGMVSHFSRSASLFITTDASSKVTDCSQALTSSAVASQYVKGQIYGHCRQSLDASFVITSSMPPAWPMLTCPVPGDPTCDTGYTLVLTQIEQMNTRSSFFVNGIPLQPDTRLDIRNVLGQIVDGDAYYAIYGCAKN